MATQRLDPSPSKLSKEELYLEAFEAFDDLIAMLLFTSETLCKFSRREAAVDKVIKTLGALYGHGC